MNKSQSKSSLDLNDKDDDMNKETNNEKLNKYKLRNIINKNRGHSEFGRQLTYNKKLENELDTLPNDLNKFFRQSLDKYKFQLEVYVPHSMVISKKEYYHKNYMLNNLVKTEDIIKGKKNQIAHISKETRKFSHQYELVKKENMPHQLNYLSKIEKLYKNKGYNTTGINYKKDDNIFNPSFLLDSKYGSNSNADVIKYGQSNYKREYKIDKMLLNKFDQYIQKKNKGVERKESNEKLKRNDTILEDDDEKQKYLAQIKKELEEQIKIQNMTQEEYSLHSNKIKKEIQSIKDTINNFKDLNDYFITKKQSRKYKTNKSNESIQNNNSKDNIQDKENKNEKNGTKKVVNFNSDIFLSSKGMKDYSKGKNENLPEIQNTSKYRRLNKSEEITKSKIGLKKHTIETKKKEIPKLLLKGIDNNNNNMEPIYLSERKLKEIQKEKNLALLYDKLNNRTSNSLFPYKQVNQYFTKYTPRRIPVANPDKGSNIHGLVEEVQNIINENNFAGFARLNNNEKRDIRIKYKTKEDENLNKKNVDDDYIINLDNKILGMHYDVTDKLLSNKNDEIHVE